MFRTFRNEILHGVTAKGNKIRCSPLRTIKVSTSLLDTYQLLNTHRLTSQPPHSSLLKSTIAAATLDSNSQETLDCNRNCYGDKR